MVCLGWVRPCAYCGGDVCDDEAYYDGIGRVFHPECFGMGSDGDQDDWYEGVDDDA